MKILIVDDSTTTTKIVSLILNSQEGYETDVANNGYQAMDKMLSFKPKLVILDLSMPGMSGQEALFKIKEINPNTKVIIASAHDDEKTKEFCLKFGALDYITKPYTSENLLKKIKTVLTSKYTANENILLRMINEKLSKNFEGVFGKNHHIEFQTVELKKFPKVQNLSYDHSETKHGDQSEIPILEIPDEQRGFTTAISGQTSGAIITVVPYKFIEMIESFSVDAVGIGGPGDLMEFFNIINAAVLSATGNYLKAQINSNPVRRFDDQIDKTVNGMDLMEINYTFGLENENTWFTVYLWMNNLPSFEKKLDGLIS